MAANEEIAPGQAAGLKLRPVLAGFGAIMVGIGLNRFSYIAFIPILISAGWLTPAQAGYLGAANLLGYLIGALFANASARHFGLRLVVRANLTLSVLSFAACAWPLGFEWLSFWRLVAGVAGAQLMVVAVPAVLSGMPLAAKGRASGIVFSGIGIGIIFSGLALPQLARAGITETWLILGVMCLGFTLAAWSPWPQERLLTSGAEADRAADRPGHSLIRLPVILLLGAYAMDAIGYVPHTVYWVDFIARGLGHGSETGGFYWMLLGLGAVFGPVIAGITADKIGFKYALISALCIKAGAIALPLMDTGLATLAASSLIVGATVPGMVALVSGFTAVLAGPERNRQVWGWMTFSFAVAQAASGYFMAWLFDASQSYLPLYAAGAAAISIGALLIAAGPRPSKVRL